MVYMGWKFIDFFSPFSHFQEFQSSRNPHFVELCNSRVILFPSQDGLLKHELVVSPIPNFLSSRTTCSSNFQNFRHHIPIAYACLLSVVSGLAACWLPWKVTNLSVDCIFPLCHRWSPWVRNYRGCKIIGKNTS